MIGLLASIALGAGVPQRFAKAAGIAGAIVALGAVLTLAKCGYDRSVIANHEAAQEAKIAPVIRQADANAADARTHDLRRNLNDEAAERAAVAPLPDTGLSARQRARACAILRRQAAERGHESPAGC